MIVLERSIMYKTAIRALLRRGIEQLNNGDFTTLLTMASPDFAMVFPGDNSWATMFRPVQGGRQPHVTHRGIEEGTAFAQRFVDEGVQFEVEDILVNGPPWNTRIALRVQSFVPGFDGADDEYANRAIALLTVKWGKLVGWEDYEATQRVAAWDDRRSTSTPSAAPSAQVLFPIRDEK